MKPTPRHLSEPSLEIPIFEWWAGCYDHVFVALNPFFRVPGYTPGTAAYGPVHNDMALEELLQSLQEPHQARPNEAPDDFEEIVKATGEIVRWAEVQAAVGAKDFMRFARTVWLWTVAVEREDRDAEICARLNAYCQREGLYRPEEDQLPAAMEPPLGRFLSALGLDTVELWNEWRSVSKICAVSDFTAQSPTVFIPGEKVTAVAAPGFLMSWSFDDVAGLLALTDAMRAKADPEAYLEGFWVTPGMYADVFNPVGFLKRQLPKPRN